MLQFKVFKLGRETVAINPIYVSHVVDGEKDRSVLVTMNDGRRYEFPYSDGVESFVSELTVLANGN